MTSSSNDSPGADSAAPSTPADASNQEATASSPASSGGAPSADVTSTGGMASGSEGTAAETGLIDDSQLPEDLRPDAEGLADSDAGDVESLGEGATEQTGQLPDPADRTPADEPDVSEPTA